MSKPKSIPVPEAMEEERHHEGERNRANREPLSGSKKVKQRNHVSHHNTEG
ncbi:MULTISPECIES: small acid-soluble spore protein P [unclassified Paenibacillus]|uniref:small acid-soluble spore protein P n=1 Tax=unclassified Paenibacillus TaxID=185978 RepID=UPI001C113939|nr:MULTISPECIES: small acid-soluble spore protein P [unclassified Paenibacillus]MBU5445134.1 small acid-soluble spore protein P [Paenibacillus sp. MSJ-34]CAH0122711.1 hypothetical protein PAE9249_05299 [Paenibacillus sp. CECT 9249]